jgi:hypothetical protein
VSIFGDLAGPDMTHEPNSPQIFYTPLGLVTAHIRTNDSR